MARVHYLKWTFHWVLLALLTAAGCRSAAPVALPVDVQINCKETAVVKAQVNAIAATAFFLKLRSAVTGSPGEDNYENVAMIGRDVNGQLTSSSIITSGRKNHATIDLNFPGSIADLHNHPGNTAPSAGDLYNLVHINKTIPAFLFRFVCLDDGTDYALAIYDAAAAAAFVKAYPPQPNPGYSPRFPDALFNEFAEIKSYLIHIEGIKPSAADEAATAFMLDKYKTGVALLKANGHREFYQLVVREERSESGKGTYTTMFCRE